MDLMIGLAAVDQVNGEKEMQQLTRGWMGWEWKRVRQARGLVARILVALAAWLATEPIAAPDPPTHATSISA